MSNQKAKIGDRVKFISSPHNLPQGKSQVFWGEVIDIEKSLNGLQYIINSEGNYYRIISWNIMEVHRNGELIYRRW